MFRENDPVTWTVGQASVGVYEVNRERKRRGERLTKLQCVAIRRFLVAQGLRNLELGGVRIRCGRVAQVIERRNHQHRAEYPNCAPNRPHLHTVNLS